MLHMNMTRREFCAAAAGAQAMAAMPSFGGAADGGKKRWYKGNMHCHTYWSDGRAFPDQAIRSYRDAGFDFCAVTDHNRMGENRDFWRKVEPTEGGWPPLVCRRNFDIYRKEFPWAEFREANGATVKSVSGDKGHRLAAEYSLAADDLYVRARVESDEPALYYTTGGDGPMHPKTSTAWTQPYQHKK